jgi:diacylglycerol kinase (ATP)
VKKRITLLDSFDCAHEGIVYTVALERNMRIHVGMAALVTLFAMFFRLSLIDCMLLLIPMAIVLAAELMNTAIEKTVDLVTKEIHPLAKIAKDVAAGAVLVSSGLAVIIGGAVMYRPAVDLLFHGKWPVADVDPAAPISYELLVLILVFTFLIGTSLNALCMANHSTLRFNPIVSLAYAGTMLLALTVSDTRVIIFGFIVAFVIFIGLAFLKNVRVVSLISGAILGSILTALVVLGLEWI